MHLFLLLVFDWKNKNKKVRRIYEEISDDEARLRLIETDLGGGFEW